MSVTMESILSFHSDPTTHFLSREAEASNNLDSEIIPKPDETANSESPPQQEDNDDGSRPRIRRRRTFQELKRDIVCPFEGCERVYASKHALQQHIRLKHYGPGANGMSMLQAEDTLSLMSSTGGSVGSVKSRRVRSNSLPSLMVTGSSLPTIPQPHPSKNSAPKRRQSDPNNTLVLDFQASVANSGNGGSNGLSVGQKSSDDGRKMTTSRRKRAISNPIYGTSTSSLEQIKEDVPIISTIMPNSTPSGPPANMVGQVDNPQAAGNMMQHVNPQLSQAAIDAFCQQIIEDASDNLPMMSNQTFVPPRYPDVPLACHHAPGLTCQDPSQSQQISGVLHHIWGQQQPTPPPNPNTMDGFRFNGGFPHPSLMGGMPVMGGHVMDGNVEGMQVISAMVPPSQMIGPGSHPLVAGQMHPPLPLPPMMGGDGNKLPLRPTLSLPLPDTGNGMGMQQNNMNVNFGGARLGQQPGNKERRVTQGVISFRPGLRAKKTDANGRVRKRKDSTESRKGKGTEQENNKPPAARLGKSHEPQQNDAKFSNPADVKPLVSPTMALMIENDQVGELLMELSHVTMSEMGNSDNNIRGIPSSSFDNTPFLSSPAIKDEVMEESFGPMAMRQIGGSTSASNGTGDESSSVDGLSIDWTNVMQEEEAQSIHVLTRELRDLIDA